jgi:hypothetical protein
MSLIPFPANIEWSDIANIAKGLPSQTFKQYLSSLDAIVRSIVSSGGAPRIVLGGPTSFYFDPNSGNDNNPGTLASPWLTPAPLSSRYDVGNQNVTLNMLSSIASGSGLSIGSWVGGGVLIIDGGGHSIAATVGPAILDNHVGLALVRNVTLSSSSPNNDGQAIDCNAEGTLFLGNGLTFGACRFAHMRLRNPGGTLFCNQIPTTTRAAIAYNTTGGATAHIQISAGVAVWEGTQVTHTNVATFTDAFLSMYSGLIFAGAAFNANNQIIHGQTFNVRAPAATQETGGNLAYFPGDTPGTVWTPAAYQ